MTRAEAEAARPRAINEVETRMLDCEWASRCGELQSNGEVRTLQDKGVTRAWAGRPRTRTTLYKPIGWGWPLCSSGGQVLMGTVFRYVGAPGGFQVRSFLELRSDDILEVALDRGFVGASATWARILGWER